MKLSNLTFNRRETLKISAGALLTSTLRPGLAAGQAARTRILLLGTAGGPPQQIVRAAPSNAIIAGGSLYVVDCGNGNVEHLTDGRTTACL